MGINDVTRMWPNQAGVKGQRRLLFFFEKSILNAHTKRFDILVYLEKNSVS